MQILASALPGFRDLRAPLAAGYLWLIFLWITIRPDLAIRPTNDVAGALHDLGKAAGPIWVAVAVSFIAFLVGAISQSVSFLIERPLVRWLDSARRRQIVRIYRKPLATPVSEPDLSVPNNISNLQIVKLYQRAILENRSTVYQQDKRVRDRFFRDLRMRATEAQRDLDVELSIPATLLIGKDPAAFSEADRLKAESQMRFAIFLPLTAIAIFLVCTQSRTWSLMAIGLLILAWQGYSKYNEFNMLMLGAVERRVIESQSIAEFDLWVNQLSGRYPGPSSSRKSEIAQN